MWIYSRFHAILLTNMSVSVFRECVSFPGVCWGTGTLHPLILRIHSDSYRVAANCPVGVAAGNRRVAAIRTAGQAVA